MKINQMQVGGIVRAIMLGLGGVLVTLGVTSAQGPGWESLTGLVVAAAGTIWSWYSNKTDSMISAVAKSEDVRAVIATPDIATNDPNPKVKAG